MNTNNQATTKEEATMSTFAEPSAPGGEKLPLPDLNGALLVIDVIEALKDVQTVHGLSDPIRATCYVIDGGHANETFEDTLIFPKVLCSQLRDRVGSTVVARLGQGNAKPGQNPPWTLIAASEADKATASAAYAKLTQPQLNEL